MTKYEGSAFMVDYAAKFFNRILEYYGYYYGYTERTVEGLISERMQKKRASLLQECKKKIEARCVNPNNNASNTYFQNIIDVLKQICSMDPMKQIDSLISLLETIEGIDSISKQNFDAANELINRISCDLPIKTGYSDSTIHGYKEKIPQNKMKGLFDYFLSRENYPPLLIESLIELIDTFSEIDHQTRQSIITTLRKGDDNNEHIYNVLKDLNQQSRLCQQSKQKPALKSVAALLSPETEEGQIYKKIMDLVEESWGNISPESLGIAQCELDDIKTASVEYLIDDYTFHQKILQDTMSVFNSSSFQAILKYRLYNALYNQGSSEDMPLTNSDETISDDSLDEYPAVMKIAMALLGKALEGSTIFIHPAANVSSPVYIGHHTIIGKQCEIGQFCILGNNVCLYPFNTLNKKRLDKYIELGNSNVVFSNTRVLGTIFFGDNCVLNSSCITGGSVSNYVAANSGITNGRVSPLEKSRVEQFRNDVIKEIKKDALENTAAHQSGGKYD